MGIKKSVKLSFSIIIILFLIVAAINVISLYKIKENNISKNHIFSIVSIQENMNKLMLDAILVDDLSQLHQIEKKFLDEEKQFEFIKENFFKNDVDDLLDKIITDLHQYEIIKNDLITLFENEKSIEAAFESITKLQERKINLENSFETLYPLENSIRKELQSYIWDTNDVSTIKHFSDLKYYSKEALYQHKDEEYLKKWIDKALYLKNHTKRKGYEHYIKIAYYKVLYKMS